VWGLPFSSEKNPSRVSLPPSRDKRIRHSKSFHHSHPSSTSSPYSSRRNFSPLSDFACCPTMRLLPILALTTSALAAAAAAARETVQDAALSARKLLHKESILTISSIFDPTVNPTLAGQPFAYTPILPSSGNSNYSRLTEYYADCSSDGNPTLLLMNLEITTRNMNHGSPLAISIETTPPKGIYSVASLPRMNMNGRMEKLTSKKEVPQCKRVGGLMG
jgi:hypothetical protein